MRAPVFLSTKAPSALITVSLAVSMATSELAKVPAIETASIRTSPAMIPYSRLWTRLLDSAWLFRGAAASLLSSSAASSWVKEAFPAHLRGAGRVWAGNISARERGGQKGVRAGWGASGVHGCLCPRTCETLCERSSGMSFICVAWVPSAGELGVYSRLGAL
eukprot:scaffold46756_cov58-Phaeocystis_antarctica.AAC.2